MKLTFLLVAAVFTAACSGLLRAEDWTTTDGKAYPEVKVVKVQPDAVTILYRDGGALVPLAKLPADLQKRFNYDPVRAQAAADARARSDAESLRILQAEKKQAMQQRMTEAAAVNAAPITEPQSNPAATEIGSPSHFTMDDLVASNPSMRRDLADPTYHTMGHLWYTSHTLAGDPSDPKHHSMSDLVNSWP
jgi:hypothetical protein